MNTHFILPILLIATLLISSCKDEENGTPRQLTTEYTYSQNIRGSAGVTGVLTLSELQLTDVLETDTAKNLTRAELQMADSYLEISGLNRLESPDTVAVVLEDFTIIVGTRPGVNLGNVSTDPEGTDEIASDVQHSTNEVVSLIQNIFTDVTSGSKRAKISVSFMPNVDITSSDSVQLIIHFGGRYHYLTYE